MDFVTRTIETHRPAQTQKIARILAEEIKKTPHTSAIVVALEGNLGAGKTTFAQGFAKAFGIQEKIKSPTFVLMKVYKIRQKTKDKKQKLKQNKKQSLVFRPSSFNHFVHIDCYRIESSEELMHLGFKDLVKDRGAVILVEWAERIEKFFDQKTLWIKFIHGENPSKRIIQIPIFNI